MKLNKYQIRLIIGLVFATVIGLALVVALKINNQKKINDEKERSRINEINFSDATQLY